MRRTDIFNEEEQLESQVQGTEPLTTPVIQAPQQAEQPNLQEQYTSENIATTNSAETALSPEEITESTTYEPEDIPEKDEFEEWKETTSITESPAETQQQDNTQETALPAPSSTEEIEEPIPTQEEVEAELDLEVEYEKDSTKDGLTVLLIIILLGSFGVHRFYAGSQRAMGFLYFIFFGVPQILLITFGLVTGSALLPPMVMQTSELNSNYAWLSTYWGYAKFVALAMIAVESLLLLTGKYRDEVHEKIKVRSTEEIFAYMLFALVFMVALFGYLGSQEAKKYEDPILKKINQATKYSN